MRRLLFLLPLLLFLWLAVYFGLGLTKDPSVIPSALVDKPAPEFSLPALHPGKQGLATGDLKGEVAIVNVFASWCVPCLIEHPFWMKLQKERLLPIHGIAWKDKRENTLRWLAKHGNPYSRIGHDPDNKAGVEWGVYGAPETYIIDRAGRIRFKYVGPIYPQIWQQELLLVVQKLKAEAS